MVGKGFEGEDPISLILEYRRPLESQKIKSKISFNDCLTSWVFWVTIRKLYANQRPIKISSKKKNQIELITKITLLKFTFSGIYLLSVVKNNICK